MCGKKTPHLFAAVAYPPAFLNRPVVIDVRAVDLAFVRGLGATTASGT